MAAGIQLIDEIYEQFLVCKICYEIYKKPKTLTCLHTFCQDCLEKHYDAELEQSFRYLRYTKVVTCPICRKKTELPNGVIRRLPDNFLVANLAGVVNRRRPQDKLPCCEICQDSTCGNTVKRAVSKCLDCAKLLCATCVELHKKTKVTAEHSIYDTEVGKDIECKIHHGEIVRFYCEQCDLCICVVCTFQEHQEHNVTSFAEGMQKYQASLHRLVSMCNERIAQVKEYLHLIMKCESQIKTAEEQIRDMAIESISEIRLKEKHMVQELHHNYGIDVLNFLRQKESLQENLNSLQSTCGLTDIMTQDRNVELLLLKKEIQEKISSLLDEVPSTPPAGITKSIQFFPGNVDFGQLSVDGKTIPGKNEPSKVDAEVQCFFALESSVVICTNITEYESRNQHYPTRRTDVGTNPVFSYMPHVRTRGLMTDLIPSSSGPTHTAKNKSTIDSFSNTPAHTVCSRATLTHTISIKDKCTTTDHLFQCVDRESYIKPPSMCSIGIMTTAHQCLNDATQTNLAQTADKMTATPRYVYVECSTMTDSQLQCHAQTCMEQRPMVDKAISTCCVITSSVAVGNDCTHSNDNTYSTASQTDFNQDTEVTSRETPVCVSTQTITVQLLDKSVNIATDVLHKATTANIGKETCDKSTTSTIDWGEFAVQTQNIAQVEKSSNTDAVNMVDSSTIVILSLSDVGTTMYSTVSSSDANVGIELPVTCDSDNNTDQPLTCDAAVTADESPSVHHQYTSTDIESTDQSTGTDITCHCDKCVGRELSTSDQWQQTIQPTMSSVGVYKRPHTVTRGLMTATVKIVDACNDSPRFVGHCKETNTYTEKVEIATNTFTTSENKSINTKIQGHTDASTCTDHGHSVSRSTSPICFSCQLISAAVQCSAEVAESTASTAALQQDDATETETVVTHERASSPARLVYNDRSCSPHKTFTSLAVEAKPDQEQKTTETETVHFTDQCTSVDKTYVDNSTCTALIQRANKLVNTCILHMINAQIATDNTEHADKHTSTSTDITAIYRDLTHQQIVTVSRGVNTQIVTTTRASSPVRYANTLIERGSSPIRVVQCDKYVTASKADLLESKDKLFTALSTSKPLKPSESIIPMLESIEEGCSEDDDEYQSQAIQTETPPRSPRAPFGRRAFSAWDVRISPTSSSYSQHDSTQSLSGKKYRADCRFKFPPEHIRLSPLPLTITNVNLNPNNPKTIDIGTSTAVVITRDIGVCTESYSVDAKRMQECISKLKTVSQRLDSQQSPALTTSPQNAMTLSHTSSFAGLLSPKEVRRNIIDSPPESSTSCAFVSPLILRKTAQMVASVEVEPEDISQEMMKLKKSVLARKQKPDLAHLLTRCTTPEELPVRHDDSPTNKCKIFKAKGSEKKSASAQLTKSASQSPTKAFRTATPPLQRNAPSKDCGPVRTGAHVKGVDKFPRIGSPTFHKLALTRRQRGNESTIDESSSSSASQ